MEVTVGGQRLGSGNKQKQELHNYNRASFNQEQDWKSTMAPGVLYPFLCIPMTNGDSMDIDLDAFVRTLPTKGPLFGSFKLQCDIFSIPMRLYNGILHNNPMDIGLKIKDVYFPKLINEWGATSARVEGNTSFYTWQVHPTSLLKYLGLSGGGLNYEDPDEGGVKRKINAIPVLGYYDIFKNYYANKQEKNAYVISPDAFGAVRYRTEIQEIYVENIKKENWGEPIVLNQDLLNIRIKGSILQTNTIEISFRSTTDPDGWRGTIQQAAEEGYIIADRRINSEEIIFTIVKGEMERPNMDPFIPDYVLITVATRPVQQSGIIQGKVALKPFPLKNIDDMRNYILQMAHFGEEFSIGNEGTGWDADSGTDRSGLPYSTLFKNLRVEVSPGQFIEYGTNYNSFPMNGLVVKTYQSDLFNNWIQTDWIEGENGIAALSAVDVSEGSFSIDALNIAEKVYNMLNRVALSGGTYEDWQEAVYTQESVRKAETPIYEGGMSAEVMFEEVIQTAETNIENEFSALGNLGGKGTLIGQKGGRDIHIKAREPMFVMGIVSLTPRICYTQGNEWYLTELNSYDDLHKPALDQIGFQDLIVEQMAWWDTKYQAVVPGQEEPAYHRHSAGKVVAWSNYMTAVDKAFGDFAMEESKNFMVLARNYEWDGEGSVLDMTTYIDPAKFNYPFAYTDITAQNFWVQIHSRVITRRVMSAHQIPNL